MDRQGYDKGKKVSGTQGISRYSVARSLLILFFFLTPLLFIYRELIFGGKVPYYMDVLVYFYPLHSYVTEVFRQGSLPLWNPYQAAGVSVIGNPQLSIFYPLNLIFYFLFPLKMSYGLKLVLHFWLGGIFTYLYARRLELSKISSVGAGLAFMLSGFLIPKVALPIILQSTIWLPLGFFAVESAFRKLSSLNLVLISLTSFMLIMSGHPPVVYFIFIILVFYVIFRTFLALKKGNSGRMVLGRVFLLGLFLSLGLLLSALQLLPTLETMILSAKFGPRSLQEFFNSSYYLQLRPDFFPTLLTGKGDFELSGFVGSVSLFLILFTLVAGPRRDMRAFFYFFMGIALFLLILISYHKVVVMVTYHIPGFKLMSSYQRLMGTFIFSLAVLLAISLDTVFGRQKNIHRSFFAAPEKPGGQRVRNFVGLLVLFLLLVLMLLDFRKFILPISGLALLIALLLVEKIPGGLKKGMLVSFVLLELLVSWANYSLEYIDPDAYYRNSPVLEFVRESVGPFRIIAFDAEKFYSVAYRSRKSILPSNIASLEKLQDAMIYDPIQSRYYKKFLFRLSDLSYKYYPNGDRYHFAMVVPFDRRLMNALSVKYVLSNVDLKDGSFGEEVAHLESVMSEEGVFLYQNTEVPPRAYLVYQYVIGDEEKILKRMRFGQISLQKTAYLGSEEEAPELPSSAVQERKGEDIALVSLPRPERSGTVEILDSSGSYVKLRSNSDSQGLLVLHDSYYPGWRAYVDGEKTRLYRTDTAFRGVFVPAGVHIVEFKYRPLSFYVGLSLSFSAIVLMAVTLRILRRRGVLELRAWDNTKRS